jgi:fatty acid amide hydrolase 2
VSDPMLLSSATELAAAIREGRSTSSAVVEAHIRQLELVNPTLNAMVAHRLDLARQEARAADERPPEVPFHGVPCSIKECFSLTGMPWTAGLLRRKGTLATSDATAVRRLRGAGAIPLGVSNTSELCMWMESDNLVYGRTNNPYDPRCTVGGSSGGEAALVGAGAVPFGLGSDIGGSIRMPAFFNGVFGHKPTGGLVPGSGQHPIADPAALRFLTTGPFCRRAEDLWPLLQILAGPDGQDTGCIPWRLGDPEAVDLAGLRVLHIPDSGAQPVSVDLRAAQNQAARLLRAAGATVEEVRIPAMRYGFDIWSNMLQEANVTPFATLMGDGEPVQPVVELLRIFTGQPRHTVMACLLGATESITKAMPRRQRRFVELGRSLRAELEDRLGDDGVLLYPSFSRPAPRHRLPLLRQLLLRFDYAYTALLNVMEIPVTQVPLGLNAHGLPLGVQVGARHGNDHLTIAVARFLEKEVGGWVPPKLGMTRG